MLLKDKALLISGKSSEFASKICLSAAAQGARLALSLGATGDAIARLVQAKGGKAVALTADDENSQCEKIVAAALEEWGQIDGLVDVASCSPPASSPEHDLVDQVSAALDASAIGGLRMKQAVFPVMLRQGNGTIVNVSILRMSDRADEATLASRSAVAEMTRQLAYQLAETGIRVNTVLKGWNGGPPVQSVLDAFYSKDIVIKLDGAVDFLERLTESKDSAAAVVCFLLSDSAENIRASTLDLDEWRWIFP